ncbi:MAG: hypothetical protein AAF918_16270 [Pseudomonadota bacterium]
MLSKLATAAGTLFAIACFLIWFAFLRDVPIQRTTSVVVNKTYKPEGTYWQQQVGTTRAFRSATPITTAEQYVLELKSPDLDMKGFFPISKWDEADYEVGAQVIMHYQVRGLPVFGYRTVVTKIERLAS